ncbi:hypothetical protein E2562_032926 [Oryza meyeriana var. granulata]|nr:hypothetical protein E2562_032926 [Oryza meyeriana var. granulata]
MASSLLRSAARELRRSIPHRSSYPPRLASALTERPRLLSTDCAGRTQSSSNHKKMNSSSPSLPNAAQFQSHLENLLRPDCAVSIETIKEQFSKDELMAFKRYLLEKMEQTLDECSDVLEERSSLLRQLKVILEDRNKRSAQK